MRFRQVFASVERHIACLAQHLQRDLGSTLPKAPDQRHLMAITGRNMMKKLITAAALTLGMALPALADPLEGVWKTEVDGDGFAHVKIAPCGGAFCGSVVKTFDKSGAPAPSDSMGVKIVRDMVAKGGGAYEGKVFRPSNGKTYLGKVQLSGNKMALKGCVAGGVICAKQNWTRVK